MASQSGKSNSGRKSTGSSTKKRTSSGSSRSSSSRSGSSRSKSSGSRSTSSRSSSKSSSSKKTSSGGSSSRSTGTTVLVIAALVALFYAIGVGQGDIDMHSESQLASFSDFLLSGFDEPAGGVEETTGQTVSPQTETAAPATTTTAAPTTTAATTTTAKSTTTSATTTAATTTTEKKTTTTETKTTTKKTTAAKTTATTKTTAKPTTTTTAETTTKKTKKTTTTAKPTTKTTTAKPTTKTTAATTTTGTTLPPVVIITQQTTTTTTPAPVVTTKTTKPTYANAANVVNPNYESTHYIVVYAGNSQSVAVYTKDAGGKYSVLTKCFSCSTGAPESPTRTGQYKIRAKYRWRLLVGNVYGQYSSSISSSYLFHSVPYTKEKVNALDMAEYEKLGTPASHGCIRLCVRDSKWIYDNCPIGTQVNIVNQSGPAGAGFPSLNYDPLYKGWDPSDPHADNPYN